MDFPPKCIISIFKKLLTLYRHHLWKTKKSLAVVGKCHSRTVTMMLSVATVNFLQFNITQQIPIPTQCSRNMQEGAEEYWGETAAADNRQPASSWEGMHEAREAGAGGSGLRGSAGPALSTSRTSWRTRAGRTGQRGFGQRPQQLKPALQQGVRWSASVAIFTFAKKVTKRISRHPWMIHHTERARLFRFQNYAFTLLGIRSSSPRPQTAVHMWLKKRFCEAFHIFKKELKKKLFEKDRLHSFPKHIFWSNLVLRLFPEGTKERKSLKKEHES